jgi:GTPase SAR1 family protein
VAIVGRPNVGKSTLLNALVGQKISITSRKAQTTRHRITGIRTLGATQFVFVDTPGFQTKHTAHALNRNLNRTVTSVLGDVDVVLFVVEAGRFGLDDAKVLALLPRPCTSRCCWWPTSSTWCPPHRHAALAEEHAGAPRLHRVRADVGHARPTCSACSGSSSPTCPSRPGCTRKTR